MKVEEIKIPLGDGDYFLAGKLWGDKTKKPIFCLHGIQDNCGSFDRLIPLLPKNFSYLAIDFFGHGLSSTLQKGLQFNVSNFLHILRELQVFYKNDKISIIGHSLGANIALGYAALYPERIKMVVNIESQTMPALESSEFSMETISTFERFYKADKRNRMKLTKSYSMDELKEKISAASGGSVTKDCAPHILNRCVKQADEAGKFYLTQDPRFSFLALSGLGLFINTSPDMIKRLKFPLLTIECTNPFLRELGLKPFHENFLEIFKENKNFELHKVDGTHHVHLTNPERISGIISDFLIKNEIGAKL